MSLESALDDERRAILELLEGKQQRRATSRTAPLGRTASPGAAQSPVRSMLDVGANAAAPRHASVAGPIVGASALRASSGSKSPPPPPIRSMLDPNYSPPSSRSPAGRNVRPNMSPPPSGRSFGSPLASPRNMEDAYQFEMLPTIERHALPKRVTQGGKKKKAAMEGGDGGLGSPRPAVAPLSPLAREARHASTGAILQQSLSPSRLGRSASPKGTLPKPSTLHLMPDPHRYQLDSGRLMDMTSAYRRLSDAALVRSGGSLAGLGKRKDSDASRSGDPLSPRLEKDYVDEEALESSEDDDSDSSSDDAGGNEKNRGRGRTRKGSSGAGGNDGSGEKRPKIKSLLAAAEEERKNLSGNYSVRSLLEPPVTVTGPDGEKIVQRKTGVHPNTSFDTGGSGVSTPVDSDAEAELSDIRRAQRLAMAVGPIQTSTEACRCLRLVLRGEYASLQREAEMGLRRQRVYLVATDLSDEAAYALEWTIGTVLRDGDTMLAVYAVDDEAGTGGGGTGASTSASGSGVAASGSSSDRISGSGGGFEIGQGAAEAESLAKTLSNDHAALMPRSAHLGSTATGSSRSGSPVPGTPRPFGAIGEDGKPDLASMSKAERESYLATMEVSDRCVKLLRKTKLQVRVVVEVFRSKSPRHTLTEVIDYLDPTLVILGSRGRSALKGVLLGSFSNYLVTKSSVPVMVARKKLRKASKSKARSNLRFANVLTNPTSKLVNAKID